MAIVQELGLAVKARRSDMGLTQATLARLSGLSRATVNQVENHTLRDLSLNRAARLLGVLGLALTAPVARERAAPLPKSPALDVAARTASVSYKTVLPAKALRRCIETATLPPGYEPHISTLLDEAPISLLARVVDELHADSGIERAALWRHLREMARQLGCLREIWQ